MVKFELLADLDDQPAGVTGNFDGCDDLGAANLRGTGFAARDFEARELHARIADVDRSVEVSIAGLARFLLAKAAAAHGRRLPKDWYDLAFVLLHNDAGGPVAAAEAVLDRFADDLPSVRIMLDDLQANFADPAAQGPRAYASQMALDHPELDRPTILADAVVAVTAFHDHLYTR